MNAQGNETGESRPPLLPSGYRVHDPDRPQPQRVDPAEGAGPPNDAVTLFDGNGLDEWIGEAGQVEWKTEDDYLEVLPGSGNIRTRRNFADVQLHLEFQEPGEIRGSGQGRGNSGVFLMGLYEIQVLDSWENPTYADGAVGAVYGQCPPLVNAIRRPGEWNSFDIMFSAPVFSGQAVVKPAFVTVLLNGVLLHHHREILGKTGHNILPAYEAHPPEGPVELQDHGDPVRFRNIWIRNAGRYDGT